MAARFAVAQAALVVSVIAAPVAWAASAAGFGAQAATAQAFAELRANLETQNAVVAQLESATTTAQLRQLLAEDSQLVSADLSLLNGLSGVSGGAGVTTPPASSQGGTSGNNNGSAQGSFGVPPAPQGTPSAPATGNPFPFP